jgi:hypothetical protein
MNFGEVYIWETTQAQGHDLRKKYHIYLCAADWREGHTFLFISKSDYGGDHKITKAECPFLPLEVSYISCSSLVFYTDDKLASFSKTPVGKLSKELLKKLYNSIHASETMVGWQISRACNALKDIL